MKGEKPRAYSVFWNGELMLLHAQPICGFFLILFREVCAFCITVSSPRAASTGEKDVENGEWAELMQNVPSIRSVPDLIDPNRGASNDKERP